MVIEVLVWLVSFLTFWMLWSWPVAGCLAVAVVALRAVVRVLYAYDGGGE